MGTVVAFHAHPDDESLIMGGSLARASREGHRVVLVVATNGDHGQIPDDLAPGETLMDRRKCETQASCDVLGVHRLVWLGYSDSGMTGWDQNTLPGAFVAADVEEAAQRLADVLIEERADVVTVYDWHGNYGHPDHIQVHKVGHRAAVIAGTKNVFETTMNRDHFRMIYEMAKEHAAQLPDGAAPDDFNPDGPADDGNPMGEPASAISHRVDVKEYLDFKRQAIACHASQVTDSSFLGNMSPEIFQMTFGHEWFTKIGESGPPRDAWLFD